MSIKIRVATQFYATSMATLLNAIIREGGTTAIVRPVTREDLCDWMAKAPDRSAWHVAVTHEEEVVGFQWITSADYLPEDAAEIATFVKIGKTGLGIGSKLFSATERAARALGYSWINANIRSDNEGGLIYYQSRGFRDYDRWEKYTLQSGEVVEKTLKRYDLY